MSKEDLLLPLSSFQDYGLLLEARTIYIGSGSLSKENEEAGLDADLAEKTIKNIVYLTHVSSEPIRILINNIGGDIYHCLAIFDVIKSSRCHVTTIALGQAMSCGSILLQAGNNRLMAPNARQMIHYGTSGIVSDNKTLQKFSKEVANLDKWMEDMYLEKIKRVNKTYTRKMLQKLLQHDTFLTAKKSVLLGLADGILE